MKVPPEEASASILMVRYYAEYGKGGGDVGAGRAMVLSGPVR
jgi:hypothetical protein